MFSWRQLCKIVISAFIDIGDIYLPCMRNCMIVTLTTGYWGKKEKKKRTGAFPMQKYNAFYIELASALQDPDPRLPLT